VKNKEQIILRIQGDDTIKDILNEFVKTDDEHKWTLLNQLKLVKKEFDNGNNFFLRGSLEELFRAVGLN
jgi:bacterioferritin (cytochrome b1)